MTVLLLSVGAISYTQGDRAWAEWMSWVLLEEEGRRGLVQAWDFVPGSNWVQRMHNGITIAERTIRCRASPNAVRAVLALLCSR